MIITGQNTWIFLVELCVVHMVIMLEYILFSFYLLLVPNNLFRNNIKYQIIQQFFINYIFHLNKCISSGFTVKHKVSKLVSQI